jgi:hypothetical protein
MEFSPSDLKDFLILAHRNTYANTQAKPVDSLRQKSRDYHFENSAFAYHDTYFGGKDFIGEEVIYFDGNPAWGMNYYGFGNTEFDATLRPFLMEEPWPEFPIRGPQRATLGRYEYTLEIAEGDLKRFSAQESIKTNGTVAYRCFLHGGLIQ